MIQSATPIEAAADSLLRIIVTGERQQSAAANPDWQKGRPWTDTVAPASTDALDVAGLAADPIGTACRAELRRIGHARSDPRNRSGPGRHTRDRHHRGAGWAGLPPQPEGA